MSGNISIKFREGKSLDTRYNYYPYWSIEVTDENDSNKKALLTLSHKQLQTLLEMAMRQELWVDLTRQRKPDFEKWHKFFKETMEKVQLSLKDYEIPDIYKKGGEINENYNRTVKRT